MESACLPPQELAGYGASGPLLDPGRGLTPSLGERCDRCFGSGLNNSVERLPRALHEVPRWRPGCDRRRQFSQKAAPNDVVRSRH